MISSNNFGSKNNKIEKIFVSNKEVTIATSVKVANTFFRRLKGLMGTASLSRGSALLISPCKQVHTFFMRYSLDIVFLDESHYIVHLVNSLPPFRISPYIKKSKKVLELPARTIEEYELKVGDKIDML